MRILVRESIFCCESSEWPWCFDSYDENHILRSWMQNWWKSLYENHNFENWKNNTFRHSSRPKWNQRDKEGSLKKRIAKKSETTVTPREAPCEILFLSLDDFCAPAWQGGKPQKVNFKHRSKKPHSLKWYPVKHESYNNKRTHFGRHPVLEK